MTRNLAYYRAGIKCLDLGGPSDFWRTVVGNFIDMAVLEWCKLFGDKSSKHSFYKLADSPIEFIDDMCESIGLDVDELAEHQIQLRRYRDKFVAHLDSEHIMNIPKMDMPHRMVAFYYSYLRRIGDEGIFCDLPANMSEYWVSCNTEARSKFNITGHSADGVTKVV